MAKKKTITEEQKAIPTRLYKPKEAFENSIWDMGWDEVIPGAAVHSFEGEIEHTVVNIQPEDRAYAETNSINKYVGDWRAFKPVWNVELCIDCQNCWVFCPDSSIVVENEKVVGVDYYHCKGCGICARECPTKALEMKPEYEFREAEK